MRIKFKSAISIVLALLMVVSVFAVITASAAQDGTIIASTITLEKGEKTANVEISLSNNPGIMGMTLSVTFDQTAVELTSVSDAGILGGSSHKPEHTSPYTLAWANDTATTNNTVNGTIATLTFNITSNAVSGTTYPIEISYDYDNYDIYDTDMNPVMFSIQNGSITLPEGETVHTHNLKKIESKVSTCLEQGNNVYYYCDDCGKYFKDAEATTETTVEAEKLPLADHNYIENAKDEYLKSEATCTSQAVYYKSCSVCGEKSNETFTYGELKSHDYSDEWKFDINGHWHECKNCGDKHDEAAHISSGAATETEDEVCTVCGYVIAPKKEHTHNPILVEGKEATCTEEGQKAYYKCEGCNKWFEDGTASIEITDKSSIVLPKKEHTPSDWILDKEATDTEKGSKHKECTVCHVTLATVEIPVITPQPSEPVTTQPSEPVTTQPSEPVTTQPSEPVTTQPSEPVTTQPSEPVTTQPSTQATTQKPTGSGSTISEPSNKTTTTTNTTGSNNGAVQTGAPSFAVLVLIVLIFGVILAYAANIKKQRK